MPNVITRPHRVAIARRSPVWRVEPRRAALAPRPRLGPHQEIEATLIEVPCLFCGGASESRTVRRRLNDTVHLTLPEHLLPERPPAYPRPERQSGRGFYFTVRSPPVTIHVWSVFLSSRRW